MSPTMERVSNFRHQMLQNVNQLKILIWIFLIASILIIIGVGSFFIGKLLKHKYCKVLCQCDQKQKFSNAL